MVVKKIILLVIVSVSLFVITACQKENSSLMEETMTYKDSRYISPEHLAMIESYLQENNMECDGLIRFYFNSDYVLLVFHDSIDTALPDNNQKAQYFIYFQEVINGPGSMIWIEDEQADSWPLTYPNSWNLFYKYAVDPSLLFGEHVKIEAVYCLESGNGGSGSTIYYATDRGDFCLIQYYGCSDIYLIPVEILQEKVIQIYENITPGGSGNAYLLTGESDMEQYIIDLDNPPEFPPLPAVEEDRNGLPWQWILPGGAVLILGAAAAIYLWHKKKKV